MRALLAAWLLAAPAAADPIKEKIEREYVDPAVSQVQAAADGKEPVWPAPPLNAAQSRMVETFRARWIEPLIGRSETLASEAARSLASPKAFEAPPPQKDAFDLVPMEISKAAWLIVERIEARFLSKLNPAGYATAAAESLGSAGAAGEPVAPDHSPLAERAGDLGIEENDDERYARREDFSGVSQGRSSEGSTRSIRGRRAISSPRPRSKARPAARRP